MLESSGEVPSLQRQGSQYESQAEALDPESYLQLAPLLLYPDSALSLFLGSLKDSKQVHSQLN